MKLASVELAGFRGFRDPTRFEFPEGFVVLTGRNGAGKSTVLDAIDFALTGTIDKFAVTGAKGGGLDSHLWWLGNDYPESQYVTVCFKDSSGSEYKITRSRNRGLEPSLSTISDWLCSGGHGEDWARTLVQTTLIRDETLSGLSMDLPQQARFEAVRAAIGGLTGPDYTKRMSEIVAAAESAKNAQNSKVEELRAEIGRTLSALTEARSIAERQADVSEADRIVERVAPDIVSEGADTGERLRRRIAERKQSIPLLFATIEKAEQAVAERDYFASDEGQSDLREASAAVTSLGDLLQTAERQLENAREQAEIQTAADAFASHMVALLHHGEEVGLIEGHCPLCDAARSDTDFAEALDKAKQRLSTRGEAASRTAAALSEAENSYKTTQAQFERANARLASLHEREENLQKLMDEVQTVYSQFRIDAEPSNIEQARQSVLSREDETAQLEHALYIFEASAAHDRVSALETRLQQLRSAVEVEVARSSAANRAWEAAKEMRVAAQTVANQVLTEKFDTVMPLLKELYTRLRPHANWREIETDFGGKVRASLNFTVGDGKNPQFLFSSGQRRAAGLAFLLAIHLSRPWSRLQSLLLDDPVQHIDDYRALNLVEVLSGIRRTGRQVIVAVEDPALADLLCRRLRSEVGELGRRFDLVTQASGASVVETQTDIHPMPREVLDFSKAS